MKTLKDIREALEIGTNEIVNAYKKATPGEVNELSAEEKKLVNQMYDKKGNLTPLGKKVMNHGKKPGDKNYIESVNEEDDAPASPDEASMAMDQAKFIGYVAKEVMEYIEGNNEFPEWMQNKLSALHQKSKDMHAVMAGKYNESVELEEKDSDKYMWKDINDALMKAGVNTSTIMRVVSALKNKAIKEATELEEKYRPATAAEIAADKKKDRAGKPRPSPSFKSIKRKQYGNMMGKLKEEDLQELDAQTQKKFSMGAKNMKAYAQKNGGVDKKDFMDVAKLLDQIARVNLLQAGQLLSRLNRLVDGMDTDVRERIYVELKKVGLVESIIEKADDDTVRMIKANPKMKDKILRGLNPKARKEIEKALEESIKEAKVECPKCKGEGCSHCDDKGYHMTESKQHAHIGGVKQADGEDKPVMQGNSKIKEARGIYTVKMKDGSIHKRTLDPQEVMKVKANPNVAAVSQVGVAREEVEIDEGKFTDKQIKMAYGILNDPRYKSGNMTAIVKKIEQIAKGLSKHPGVMKAIKVTNENVDERKLTPKEIKRALASGKAKAKPKSQVSLKKAPFEIPESLEEKLKVSDGMGAWIKDFQKSDAPQFEGKSEKERKEMAIAAYLSAKKEEK